MALHGALVSEVGAHFVGNGEAHHGEEDRAVGHHLEGHVAACREDHGARHGGLVCHEG